jgi:hypothetical protein
MPSIKSKLATESGGAPAFEVSEVVVLPVDFFQARSSVGIVHDRAWKDLFTKPTNARPTNNGYAQ